MASKKCTLAWIKPYIGTEGNEAADEAARQGAENKNKTHQIINKHMPAEPVKSIIGKAIRKEWQNKWNNAPHYITRNYFIRVQTKTEPSVYLISPGHT